MKKLLILSMILFAFACKKADTTQPTQKINTVNQNTCPDVSTLKNVTWHNVTDTLPSFRFTDDSLFVNAYHAGKWTLMDGCSEYAVQGNAIDGSPYVFEFKITSLTSDTLKILALTGDTYTANQATSIFHR